MNQKISRSVDGGRTFAEITGTHVDHHDLWIDPANSRRMIDGNDGGACVSFNGGVTWSTIYNQPTAEFYHLATDTRFPYRVYGTQQDNSAICVPSMSNKGAILWADCYTVGSSESGQIAVRPDNPDIVYSGAIGSFLGAGPLMIRYDHGTAEFRNITVWPDITGLTVKDRRYRFQWDYPIVISPHDPNVLYCAGNVVFRSTNEGASWEVISPDLTRNDLAEREPVDPLTNIAPFERCTISRFAESPLEPGMFWAGADDGLIHVSRDGGETWENVTPEDLPEWSHISGLDPSHHEPGAAYVAAIRYHFGDYRPYLYKTHDYGRSWEKITSGIADIDFTRAVREDPSRRGLIYAGTEGGVYVSLDDGASWQSMQLNLPPVPVHAMVVKDGDLVVATHGRSFWILDDLTPLHQLTDEVADSPVYLFRPRPTHRFDDESSFYPEPGPGPAKNYYLCGGVPTTFRVSETPEGGSVRRFLDAGQNPHNGVVATYYLKEKPESEVKLTFLDLRGQVVKSFSSKAPEKKVPKGGDRETRVAARAGMNRFVWDMRYPGVRKVPGDPIRDRSLVGPLAPPGTYQVQLAIGDQAWAETFEIRKDPRIAAAQEELEAQSALLIKVRDKLLETHEAATRIRRVREQVEAWAQRAEGQSGLEAVAKAAEGLKEKLSSVESELVRPQAGLPWMDRRGRGALYVKPLNGRLGDLADTVRISYAAPTQQSYEVFEELSRQTDQQLGRLKEIIDSDLGAFNGLVRELDVPAIVP